MYPCMLECYCQVEGCLQSATSCTLLIILRWSGQPTSIPGSAHLDHTSSEVFQTTVEVPTVLTSPCPEERPIRLLQGRLFIYPIPSELASKARTQSTGAQKSLGRGQIRLS